MLRWVPEGCNGACSGSASCYPQSLPVSPAGQIKCRFPQRTQGLWPPLGLELCNPRDEGRGPGAALPKGSQESWVSSSFLAVPQGQARCLLSVPPLCPLPAPSPPGEHWRLALLVDLLFARQNIPGAEEQEDLSRKHLGGWRLEGRMGSCLPAWIPEEAGIQGDPTGMGHFQALGKGVPWGCRKVVMEQLPLPLPL